MFTLDEIAAVFDPRSIAVIGASRDSEKERLQGWTGRLLQFGYRGQIYPVNPLSDEILGLKTYHFIGDIPGPVDYAIVSVQADLVPKAVAECSNKGVRAVHVFTAGFSETGKERGEKLQEEIKSIIRNSSTRVVGPNCMGVYCPRSGLTFDTRFSRESGTVALVSQTGVGARQFIYSANQRGITFSKAVSYGNAVDLDSTDFLEYLTNDPETKLIVLYIEGVRDGRRFYRMVSECVRKKPVIILKSGLSESGAGAVASHTASLGGSRRIWQAVFNQTGAIPVETLEEAIEQIVALSYMPMIRGRRIGIVGRGGGPGVIAVDICEREGLSVPELTTETRAQLERITPAEAGSSVRNPVEVGIGTSGASPDYARGIEIVASDPQVDLVITHLNPEGYIHYGGLGNWSEDLRSMLLESSKIISKPLMVVLAQGQTIETFGPINRLSRELMEAGLPVFPSMEDAIKAVSKTIRYYEFLNHLEETS